MNILSSIASSPVFAGNWLDSRYEQSAALLSAGREGEALALLRSILAERGDHFKSLLLLGQLLCRRGNYSEALSILDRAMIVNRKDAEILFLRGLSQQSLGRNLDAIASYNEALRLRPDHAESHNNLGLAFYRSGKMRAAETSFKRAISLAPDFFNAHYNLGIVEEVRGNYPAAEKSFRRAVSIMPSHAEALTHLGVVLQAQRRLLDAIACYRQALSIDGGIYAALLNLGVAHQALGNFAQAKEHYARAMDADPLPVKACLYYANASKFSDADSALISRMENMLRLPDLSWDTESDIRFALGKCMDDLGRYDEAFAHYARGNELLAGGFDRERHVSDVSDIIGKYSAQFFAKRRDSGNASELPLLVVGMPRSGTSLVEQILASHPAVFGADELHFWNEKIGERDHPERISPEMAEATGEEYHAHLAAYSPEALRVVDKMPGNLYNLGLIHLCLPNARFIHCRRERTDNCLSIYFQKFSSGHAYAYSLDDLACVFDEHERLMAHWKEIFPHRILEVDYEELVSKPEATSRKILAFCGLDWNEKCLEFDKTARPVLTASSWQVKQPLYKTSIARWRHYEKHLGPLRI